MLQPLIDAFRDVPRLGLVLGAALLAVLAALAMLRTARQLHQRSQQLQQQAIDGDFRPLERLARAPSRMFECCVMFAPLLVLVTTGIVLERARAGILGAVRTAAQAADVNTDQLFADALQSSFAASAVGLIGTALAVVIAGVASGFAGTARMRLQDLMHGSALQAHDPSAALAFARYAGPPAGAVVGGILGFISFAFGPVAIAGIVASIDILERWAGLAQLDVSARVTSWDAALHAARNVLDLGFAWSVVGTIVATVGWVGLAWWISPARMRNRMLGRPVATSGARSDLTLAFAALAMAALLAGLAVPLRRENATEWPPGSRFGLGLSAVTPQLHGPDPVADGPLVELTSDSITVDRIPSNAQDLERQLRGRAEEYRVLHPHDAFTGSVRIACARDTPVEQVSQLLQTLARVGYDAPTFVFDVQREFERPVLGRVVLHQVSGARTMFSEAPVVPAGKSTAIAIREASTCAELCQRIVSARRSNLEVTLTGSHQP